MKKHGKYGLASINDIRAAMDNGELDYVNSEVQRMKRKYKNTKRHKEKVDKWKKRTFTRRSEDDMYR